MTYRDILTQERNLGFVNQIDGSNPRFGYGVSRNKDHISSITKHLSKEREPSKEITEYWEELDKLNTKYAEIDDTGTVIYVTVDLGGGQSQRGFKKVIGEGNPLSKYSQELEKLKKSHKAALDAHEAKMKAYNEMLDDELPEGEYRKFMIDLDIVPAGLHQKAMDGCYPFIKEVPEDQEEKSEEPKKPKSK